MATDSDRSSTPAPRAYGALLIFLFFAVWLLDTDRWLSILGLELDESQRRVLGQVVGIGFWLAAARAANRLLTAMVSKRLASRAEGRNAPRLLIDILGFAINALAVAMIVSTVFGQPLTGFWATSGVLGLTLGFALRNMILDLFTGIAVNVEQPYRMGDWLEVHLPGGPQVGRIVEMNWRTTRLATESGDVVLIPNGVLAELAVIHLGGTERVLRGEVEVRLDFSVPVARARRLIEAAVTQVLDRRGFVAERRPQVLVAHVDSGGVSYTARYWTSVWKELSPSRARDAVLSSIVEHLRQAGLSPAREKDEVLIGSLPTHQIDSLRDDDRVELLSRVELFRALHRQDLDGIAGAMRLTSLSAGSTLLEAGAVGESMYLVVEGVLDVFVSGGDDGPARKVSRMGPGEVLGEMCLLTGEPRSATVIAVTEAVLYEVTREPLLALFVRRPEVAERMSEVMAHRLSARHAALPSEEGAAAAAAAVTAGQLLGRIRSVFRSAWSESLGRNREKSVERVSG